MPTIALVCPKGGAGKTTTAIVLATFLSKLYDVTMIDADPNRPIADWASGGNVPTGLTIISNVDEETIGECIEDAAAKTPFVIVDLEGTASKIVLHAIAQADFVVVPMQASFEDAKAAGRAVRVIRQSQKPFAVLLTRTSAMIRTRSLIHILKGLIEAGVPILKTELKEREAFRALFSFQRTLDDLDPKQVPNLDKAKRNAAEFAEEVIARIVEQQGADKVGVTSDPELEGAA